MKKLGTGFAAVLFFAVMAISANAFASLDDGGFMNEVLTRRNPTPWNVVKHYVGNKPALIVKILKEQGFNLSPAVKYPVGVAVKVPQKYVLKELLPTPSQAEVRIKDAEHQAELQKQANEFFAALKSKETSLVTSFGFNVLLVLTLVVAIIVSRSWRNKCLVSTSIVSARENEIEKDRDYQRKLKSLANSLEKEISELRSESAVKGATIAKLLAQIPGQCVLLKDHSGKEHKCLISWTGWDEKNKTNDVWLQCPYCDLDAKNILGHIAGSHPEQMSPDPKNKPRPGTLTITTEALISEDPFKK